jgi:hypothetical protein
MSKRPTNGKNLAFTILASLLGGARLGKKNGVDKT